MDIANKLSLNSPSNLPTKFESGSLRQALADRMVLSEALQIVGKLLSCYPNGGAQAGKSYVGALAAILVTYPRTIAQQSADPLKGVPRERKFLPTPADLIAWCERETAALRGPVDREDHYSKLAREAQERREEGEYWERARTTRPTLDELRAKHGENWGLKDPLKRESSKKIPWDQQALSWDQIQISDELRNLIAPALVDRITEDAA